MSHLQRQRLFGAGRLAHAIYQDCRPLCEPVEQKGSCKFFLRACYRLKQTPMRVSKDAVGETQEFFTQILGTLQGVR